MGLDDTTIRTGNLSRKRIRGTKIGDDDAAIPPLQDAPTTSRVSSKSHCSDGEEEINGTAPAVMMPFSQVREEPEEGTSFSNTS